MRSSLRPLVVAIPLVAAGCATVRPAFNELPDREITGHVTTGATGTWFHPCGSPPTDSGQWVVFTDRSIAQHDSLRAAGLLREEAATFVRWRAAVTTRGDVGPRGAGVPALLVRELIVARPAAGGDCTS